MEIYLLARILKIMATRGLIFSLILPVLCFGASWQAHDEEEALALRRIADFWQEGEYLLAKNQIEEFLGVYPESTCASPLVIALGDLFLREKNYSAALASYSQAKGEYAAQVFFNRMHCLYYLQWYATLADECELFLESDRAKDPGQKLQATYFLAISLFQQCLDSGKQAGQLEELAARAEPYFETLFESELSDEVAQAFAHLCYILKRYEKASEIYLGLAKKESVSQEEMLFQAALLQSEYDPELAIETFEKIIAMGEGKSQEAAYNRMVLLFDAKRYQEVIDAKELTPQSQQGFVHLYRGRSHFSLNHYPEAIEELHEALADEGSKHMAFLTLFDIAHAAGDLETFRSALEQFTTLFPQDQKLDSMRFAKAQLLKRHHRTDEAKAELEYLLKSCTDPTQSMQISFELAHLEFQEKNWASCRKRAESFLSEFGDSALSPYAWRYLASASMQLGSNQQLALDLEKLLEHGSVFAPEEKNGWQLVLAKAKYDLEQYAEAIALLEPLVESDANAKLLLALCYRDGQKDMSRFCRYAEEALQGSSDLMEKGALHILLFNAYLSMEEIVFASCHLYEAFTLGEVVQRENLLWLADYYFSRIEECVEFVDADYRARYNEEWAMKAIFVLERLQDPDATSYSQLARLYALEGKGEKAVALLEGIKEKDRFLQLLLAEAYVKVHRTNEAMEIFDRLISSSSTLRERIDAKACLAGAKLLIASFPEKKERAAMLLKNLVLQKNLLNEPIYLDAALTYADLLAGSKEKRLALLIKMKGDFESQEDLLSKDYHLARAKHPNKDRLYRFYLTFMDAEILLCRAELLEEEGAKLEMRMKAKDLLVPLLTESLPASLTERIHHCLQN